MIAIPSVNPDQDAKPEELGEERMAQFLASKFKELGADEVEIEDLRETWVGNKTLPSVARPNVYGIFRSATGTADVKWVAVDVHIDTVSVTGVSQITFVATATAGGDFDV